MNGVCRAPFNLYQPLNSTVTWNKQTRALFKALNTVDTVDLYAITTDHAAVTFDVLARSSDWVERTPNQEF